jgi:hypothetical protein
LQVIPEVFAGAASAGDCRFQYLGERVAGRYRFAFFNLLHTQCKNFQQRQCFRLQRFGFQMTVRLYLCGIAHWNSLNEWQD